MNILLVNPVHPSTPHISAVRAWRFACELAALGHHVILLTAAREGHPQNNFDHIADHDWSQVFVLACETANQAAEKPICIPKPLRKFQTGWHMLRHGGNQTGWSVNVVKEIKGLSKRFKPDVVWCTFGMLEAVVAAKRIAANAACPWILDIKDDWELFVPWGLRRLMVWRTSGWAAVTANAGYRADKARIWQKTEACVVYSGVDEVFFKRTPDSDENRDIFFINLVGSVYFTERLAPALAGIDAWIRSLSSEQRANIMVRYLGGDTKIVADAARESLKSTTIEIKGYLNVEMMAEYCRAAAVNLYIVHPGNFHHKLLELLACGRPLMAYPEETMESRELARQASGVLIEAADTEDVSVELSRLHQSWLDSRDPPSSPDPIRLYSWANQTKMLEEVLADVVSS